MAVKLIVFDLDGTLVDSNASIVQGFRHALLPFGVEVTHETIEQIRHKQPHRVFEDFLSDVEQIKAIERLKDYFWSEGKNVPLYPGVEKLLELIKIKNLKMAVWTGRGIVSTKMILKEHGIYDYFEFLVAGDELEKNKPDPEGLNLILKKFSVQKTEVIMVGDHIHDLQAAGSIGVRALGCEWGGVFTEQIRSSSFETFQTVSSLMEFIEAI